MSITNYYNILRQIKQPNIKYNQLVIMRRLKYYVDY